MTLQFTTVFHPVSISSLQIHSANFTSSLNQMMFSSFNTPMNSPTITTG